MFLTRLRIYFNRQHLTFRVSANLIAYRVDHNPLQKLKSPERILNDPKSE